jgi:hypothetical protein
MDPAYDPGAQLRQDWQYGGNRGGLRSSDSSHTSFPYLNIWLVIEQCGLWEAALLLPIKTKD